MVLHEYCYCFRVGVGSKTQNCVRRMSRTKRAKRSKFCGSKSSSHIRRYVNDPRTHAVSGDDDEVIIVSSLESEFRDSAPGELTFSALI